MKPGEWEDFEKLRFQIRNDDNHIDIQTIIMTKMAAKNITPRTLAWLIGMKRPVAMVRFLDREIQLRSYYLFRIFRILNIRIDGWLPEIEEHPNLIAFIKGESVPDTYSFVTTRKSRQFKVWRRGRKPEDFFVDKDHGLSWV